jgi:acyl-CoA synthetase (AMP-forming)/AMP-acid ligase II
MSTLAHLLHQAYREAPDRTVIELITGRQSARSITGRDFMRGAVGYAEAYRAASCGPGDVVVLILQHGAPLIDAFFGAILHGAIPSIMPFLTEKLSPEKYRRDLAALLAVTRPAAVVTYREFEPEVRAAAQGSSVRAILIDDAIGPADVEGVPLAGLNRSPDDIALLQHSSGTTGLQKGVALSHRAVLNQLESYAEAIRLKPDDVVVSWLPLYHDMGLIAGFILPILRRVPLVLMSPFDWVRAPYMLLQAVSRYKGTLTWLPNFAYNFCAHAGRIRARDLEGVDLSSWRAVINCSEPMRYESHQMFLQRFAPYGLRAEALATCYAMAENVFAVTQGGIDAPVVVDEIDSLAFFKERLALKAQGTAETIRMLSAGQPIRNVRVRVLDEQRRDLPERHIGELALNSDCMLTGYFHRDDLTAQAFVTDSISSSGVEASAGPEEPAEASTPTRANHLRSASWYLTGDLGYIANGEVYVVGRKKDLIIVGGKNVYPSDLEYLASEVPGVVPGRVVAFGVFNEHAGTEDVVMIAETDDEDVDARQRLADAIRDRVTRGSDIALRKVHIVGPRWVLKTSSGKVARAANREKYLKEIESLSG